MFCTRIGRKTEKMVSGRSYFNLFVLMKNNKILVFQIRKRFRQRDGCSPY